MEVDGEPHPVLRIEIGRATRQCHGEELIDFGEAIISQVEAAMHSKFSDQAGCPEQMIVVAYCSGASSMQVHFPADMPCAIQFKSLKDEVSLCSAHSSQHQQCLVGEGCPALPWHNLA